MIAQQLACTHREHILDCNPLSLEPFLVRAPGPGQGGEGNAASAVRAKPAREETNTGTHLHIFGNLSSSLLMVTDLRQIPS
eukprot:762000-Hanusia_phi.AAC.2